MVDISIVIRTKNEEKSIGKVLNMVFRQEIDKEFEVIIVDDSSTDSTLSIASSYGCKIINLPPKTFTYPHGLNVGAINARGKYIVYLSAHSSPVNEEWLHHLIKHFKDPLVAGVFGRQIPTKGVNPIEEEWLLRVFPSEDKPLVLFSSANCAIKKEVWEKYPFNETLPLKKFKSLLAGEDFLWALTIIKNGYKIVYEPNSAVYHSHPFSFYYLKKVYGSSYNTRYFSEALGKGIEKQSSIEDIVFNTIQAFKYFFRHHYFSSMLLYPFYLMLTYYGAWKGRKDAKKNRQSKLN